MIGPLARKALADVLRRPVRSLLVILGILIGVFGLTAINVASDAVLNALRYTANETQAANVELFVDHIAASAQPQLAAQPNVAAAQLAAVYTTRWRISATPGHVNIVLWAYPDLQHVAVNPFQLTAGRLPGTGEIVLEASDAALQPVKIGDLVTVESPTGPQTLRVVGLARTLGAASAGLRDVATGYMSLDGLAAVSGQTGLNVALFTLRDTTNIDHSTRALSAAVKADGAKVLGYFSTANPFAAGPLPGLFTIMRALSIVALLLSAFLIINTISTLVAEQTKMIGTMKAIGGQRGTIARSYLTSVLIYAGTGTALGLALGVFGGYVFASYIASLIILDLGPFGVAAGAVALSVAVGLGVPVLAALVPLWNGTRITVREALAAYGVSAGNGAGGGLGWLPAAARLGVRGVFRRRGRAALTLLALAASGAAFLAIQTTTVSVNNTLDQLFSAYNADVFLNIQPAPTSTALSLIQSVPNVGRVEQTTGDELYTSWGLTIVRGFQPDTQIYRYHLLGGQWLDGQATDEVVISDLFAQHSHLAVGGTLTLATATDSVTYRIVGEVHDLNGGIGVIGSVFLSNAEVTALNQAPTGEAGGFMIQAQDRSDAAVNQLATALDTALSAKGLAPAIQTRQQQVQRNQMQFQVLYYLLYAAVVIVALVGMLSLANTLTTSVLERRREIGILRSMGATSRRVATVFLAEGVVLTLIAWLTAIAIGIPGALAFVGLISQVLLPIQFAFAPLTLGAMLIFMLAVAALASFGPANSAARARIADILRYE